ncbi:MAG TPA: DNA primase [Acidimicrobiia bacterium]|nr:DNA primase [Acidimicrobiia bacterium]
MYNREDIDRVRAATNLVDLVGAVTTVKRSGRSYSAVCPFHQEKTPSLSLDPVRGLYHCFGCGKGGDVYTFVQETQGLDFNEAVEFLARQAGLQIETDPGASRRRGEHEEMVEAVRQAVRFYQKMLRSSPDAGHARAYLRGRGLGAEAVDQYEIGYGPESDTWDQLVRSLRTEGVKDSIMMGSGLAKRGRGGKLFDVFRDRLLFPIHDLRGDPVGFGGRTLSERGPKYLNSADSRIYQKSRLLYGLHRAKGDIARTQEAVVVEGYFDVIAVNQAGVNTAVATCGTALGEDHFDLLRRFTDRVVLVFDSDQAGAGAALRGDTLRTPVDLDFDLRVADLPGGMDPADLVQAGRSDDLSKAIADSRPLLQFRIEKEVRRHRITEPEGRARAIRNTSRLISRVSEPIARAEYVRFAAKEIGVDTAAIENALRGQRDSPALGREGLQETNLDPIQAELIRVLLANPQELSEVVLDRTWVDEPLADLVAAIDSARKTVAAGIPIKLDDLPHQDLVQRLAFDTRPLPSNPGEILQRVEGKAIERQIKTIEVELQALDPASQQYSEHLRRLLGLQERRRGRE